MSKAEWLASQAKGVKPGALGSTAEHAVKERPFQNIQLRFVQPCNTAAAPGSVFSEIQRNQQVQMNVDLLKAVVEETKAETRAWRRPQEVGKSVLNDSRLMQISLFLSKLKMSASDLTERVRLLQSAEKEEDDISQELLAVLKDAVLTQQEKQQLLPYADTPLELRRSEQAILPLLKLEMAHVRAMCFSRSRHSTSSSLTSRCNVMSKAAKEILSSQPLKEVMALVLQVGNFLNGFDGTPAAVNAFAFESLFELRKLKVNVKKNINALHFVALSMTTTKEIFVESLRSVPVAAKDKLASIESELKGFSADLEFLRRRLAVLAEELQKEHEKHKQVARQEAERSAMQGEDFDASSALPQAAWAEGDVLRMVSGPMSRATTELAPMSRRGTEHPMSRKTTEGPDGFLNFPCPFFKITEGSETQTTAIGNSAEVFFIGSNFNTPRSITPRGLRWPSDREVPHPPLWYEQELYVKRLQAVVTGGTEQERQIQSAQAEMLCQLSKAVSFIEPSAAPAASGSSDKGGKSTGKGGAPSRLLTVPEPGLASAKGKGKGKGPAGSSATAKAAERRSGQVLARQVTPQAFSRQVTPQVQGHTVTLEAQGRTLTPCAFNRQITLELQQAFSRQATATAEAPAPVPPAAEAQSNVSQNTTSSLKPEVLLVQLADFIAQFQLAWVEADKKKVDWGLAEAPPRPKRRRDTVPARSRRSLHQQLQQASRKSCADTVRSGRPGISKERVQVPCLALRFKEAFDAQSTSADGDLESIRHAQRTDAAEEPDALSLDSEATTDELD